MADAKVIVIEAVDLEARSLQTLLRFLDLEPIHVHDLNELRLSPHGASQDCLAVIVGKDVVAAVGAALVAQLRAMPQPLPVIYLSNDGLPKIAETSRDLAWFHLELPVKQRRLSAVLNQAQSVRTGHPTQPGAHRFRPSGTSRPMRAVHKLIEQVAPFDTNVLILGESGTGKELLAQAIHRLGARSQAPWVAVNLSAIPKDLVESALFGHERGAFTGATDQHIGYLEEAGKGTLFLDEIGDLAGPLQVKLLRVIQEKEFRRLKGTRTLAFSARLICATHRDLPEEVKCGRFRRDLFHRVAEVTIHVPALRDRQGDIDLLIDHFLVVHCGGRSLRPRG